MTHSWPKPCAFSGEDDFLDRDMSLIAFGMATGMVGVVAIGCDDIEILESQKQEAEWR